MISNRLFSLFLYLLLFSILPTLAQLLMKIPGVQVAGDGFNTSVTIFRGIGKPLFVVDGFPLAQGTGEIGSSLGVQYHVF
jgi:hypothetical protein